MWGSKGRRTVSVGVQGGRSVGVWGGGRGVGVGVQGEGEVWGVQGKENCECEGAGEEV